MNTTQILRQSNSWAEFKANLQQLDNKGKGDCFEDLTIHYLQLHPNYATKLEHVWRLRDVPPKVKESLNLPGPDEGIDIVAKTKEGEYWAVQCKYIKDETKSLSRREFSTFTDLTFNLCKDFTWGLICTTADRLSSKLTLYPKISSICGDTWRELDDEFFTTLHEYIAGRMVLPKPSKPRLHQWQAIEEAYKHFIEGNNSRGKLIMPCGTGKSLAAYWIAHKLDAGSILIAVPSLNLIRQTLEVWARESMANENDIHWICVCSDETVADIGKEDIAILAQDLGIRIHTDPKEIAEWLRDRRQGITVVLTTYQSGKAIADATKKAGWSFDVGIMDEAHKTAGKIDSLFSQLLYDENIEIKKRIFMTATERQYIGASDQIASMDNADLYGETFELLTFKTALESQPPILSDYKIITIYITRQEIASLIEENLYVKPDKWDKDVEAQMLASAIALRKAISKHDIQHAISFHSSIARAKAFKDMQDKITDTVSKYGDLETFHVSGKMHTSDRKRQIDEFQSSRRGLITNARCLTEGVDVPNIDCVLFADPRRSKIDIVQAVGRALRPAEGKDMGYVVIPVLIDGEGDNVELIQSDAFSTVLSTLRALAANDSRIIDYFRSISQGRISRRDAYPLDIDIPEGLGISVENFSHAIGIKVWSRLARLAWRPFDEARQFTWSLGLRNKNEWGRYSSGKLHKKGKKPDDIPNNPYQLYKDEGWISWGDWLGTGTVASFDRIFRSFEEARQFARSLDLSGKEEWTKYYSGKLPEKGKKPDDIPANPRGVYRDKGWINWGDWLGTGTLAPSDMVFRPFKEAREFIRSLGLNNQKDWYNYCRGELPEKGKKPDDIPANPMGVYKDRGWVGLGDWLGTGALASSDRQYRQFEEAREFARNLGLKNVDEWKKYSKGELPEKGKKPDDIPANPGGVYKDKGWAGFGDWLGTGTVANQNRLYRPFEDAREFTRSLRLSNRGDWRRYLRGELPEKPNKRDDIPAYPEEVYKNEGWAGWGDWLGTGNIRPGDRVFRPFTEARDFARSLGLSSETEWKRYSIGKLPEKG